MSLTHLNYDKKTIFGGEGVNRIGKVGRKTHITSQGKKTCCLLSTSILHSLPVELLLQIVSTSQQRDKNMKSSHRPIFKSILSILSLPCTVAKPPLVVMLII